MPRSASGLFDGEGLGAFHRVDVNEHGKACFGMAARASSCRGSLASRADAAEIRFLEPGAEAYVFTIG